MRAVIIGASGGIGRAVVEALIARADVDAIYSFSRTPTEWAHAKVRSAPLDLLDEASIAAAAKIVANDGAPDLVFVATGLLSNGAALQPEKSLRQQSAAAFEQVFAINTFGPALVAKHFIPIMPRQTRAVFAALSARVGSISDNRLGGWHAYRASKAALNMLIQNYAIEQRRRNEAFIAISLHPGTVDTALSKPFQGNVPDQQLFSPDKAARKLLDVIALLEPADSGKCFDWAGAPIPA
ncbi:MAG: SDR family NAD(P)-dependent oxidoreductase [Pseudomonadota bacterium]